MKIQEIFGIMINRVLNPFDALNEIFGKKADPL
jgi:hypothetical protein